MAESTWARELNEHASGHGNLAHPIATARPLPMYSLVNAPTTRRRPCISSACTRPVVMPSLL